MSAILEFCRRRTVIKVDESQNAGHRSVHPPSQTPLKSKTVSARAGAALVPRGRVGQGAERRSRFRCNPEDRNSRRCRRPCRRAPELPQKNAAVRKTRPQVEARAPPSGRQAASGPVSRDLIARDPVWFKYWDGDRLARRGVPALRPGAGSCPRRAIWRPVGFRSAASRS
jgi:hypothetical protein